jgi:hypothetical protein
MTATISGKHHNLSGTAMGVTVSLCMVLMVSDCIHVGSGASGDG